MELGQKLKQARLEAGLSQRQLCGNVITRNMLSQIENGTANPGLETLRYLAGQLDRPLSYFLEETPDPDREKMELARSLYAAHRWEELLRCLQEVRDRDGLWTEERKLLKREAFIGQAELARKDGRTVYARELLDRAGQIQTIYPGRERDRLLLWAELNPGAGTELPNLDRELQIRATAVLERGDLFRAGALLDGAEHRDTPQWNLLRGEVFFRQGDYTRAADCFSAAEEIFPERTAPRLEACYRELQDYKKAYEYACRRRKP